MPVLPAKVVMALLVLVKVKLPAVPNNSKDGVSILAVCVTLAVELKVRLVVAVKPAVLTVPMAYPLFSRNDTVPVLPAKVVMALLVLVKV